MSKKLWTAIRTLPRGIVLAGAVFELLMAVSTSASAVPAYTRRYGVECSSCHSVWGALTGAGNTFKLSGYRAINGVALKPDTPDIEIARGSLTIPATLPLSFITGVGYDSRSESRTFTGTLNQGIAKTSSSQSGSTFALEDASIFLTAPIGKNLSAFVEFPMYEARAWEFTPTGLSSVYAANALTAPSKIKFSTEQPGFEVAKFFWNNIAGDRFPTDSVNLLFGITHLPLAYSPGKVRLPVNQHLVYERRALDLISRTRPDELLGDSNDGLFRLSEPQGIVELFGMVVPGGEPKDVKDHPWIEYHLGLSNGSNAKADNNESKDLYGRVTLRGKGQSLGFFAYHSEDTYDDALRSGSSIGAMAASANNPTGPSMGIMSGAQGKNSHTTYGPNFTLSLVPFGLPLWLDNDILFRKESNPTGFGVPFNWKGGLHQLNWGIDKETMAYTKYDWVRGNRFDDRLATVNGVTGTTLVEPKEQALVIGVQHLVSPAMKMIAEFRTHKFEDLAGAGELKDNGLTLRFMMGF